MDKQDLVAQLVRQLQATARAALSARDAAAAEAREGATPDEKREDARAAHQLGTLGKAQQRRAQQALAEVDARREVEAGAAMSADRGRRDRRDRGSPTAARAARCSSRRSAPASR